MCLRLPFCVYRYLSDGTLCGWGGFFPCSWGCVYAVCVERLFGVVIFFWGGGTLAAAEASTTTQQSICHQRRAIWVVCPFPPPGTEEALAPRIWLGQPPQTSYAAEGPWGRRHPTCGVLWLAGAPPWPLKRGCRGWCFFSGWAVARVPPRAWVGLHTVRFAGAVFFLCQEPIVTQSTGVRETVSRYSGTKSEVPSRQRERA